MVSENKSLIKLLLILAHADEYYHDNEEAFIKQTAQKYNVSLDSYSEILLEVQNDYKNFKESCISTLEKILSVDDRKIALKLLSDLAAADYILHEDEILLLQLIAEEWGMYKKRLIEKEDELR